MAVKRKLKVPNRIAPPAANVITDTKIGIVVLAIAVFIAAFTLTYAIIGGLDRSIPSFTVKPWTSCNAEGVQTCKNQMKICCPNGGCANSNSCSAPFWSTLFVIRDANKNYLLSSDRELGCCYTYAGKNADIANTANKPVSCQSNSTYYTCKDSFSNEFGHNTKTYAFHKGACAPANLNYCPASTPTPVPPPPPPTDTLGCCNDIIPNITQADCARYNDTWPWIVGACPTSAPTPTQCKQCERKDDCASAVCVKCPQCSPAPTPSVPPVVSLDPTSATVHYGQPASYSWTSRNATACAFSKEGSSVSEIVPSTKLQGSATTNDKITQNVNYILTCSGPGGTATATMKVTVDTTPVITFQANPINVSPGGAATLSWSTISAKICTPVFDLAHGVWSMPDDPLHPNHEQGTALVSNITQATKYSIKCCFDNNNCTTAKDVTVDVSDKYSCVTKHVGNTTTYECQGTTDGTGTDRATCDRTCVASAGGLQVEGTVIQVNNGDFPIYPAGAIEVGKFPPRITAPVYVVGATVTLLDSAMPDKIVAETVTDVKGKFLLKNIPIAPYMIKIEKIGYVTYYEGNAVTKFSKTYSIYPESQSNNTTDGSKWDCCKGTDFFGLDRPCCTKNPDGAYTCKGLWAARPELPTAMQKNITCLEREVGKFYLGTIFNFTSFTRCNPDNGNDPHVLGRAVDVRADANIFKAFQPVDGSRSKYYNKQCELYLMDESGHFHLYY